jgi:NitT/TauT family transport system substrate-binding protein
MRTKTALAFSPAADFTPVFAAKDKGFFEKRGLDATLTRIPLASNIPAAIVSVSLVARSGENIKSAADLKGKKVGVPGLNSMLHVLFQKWLLDNKIPLAQVTMIEAPFPQMRDLLKGGTLDAAVAIEPFRARILSDNTGYRVADPKAIQAFREAYEEALAWCVQNPEEARALQTKYLGVPSPVIPSYSTRISAADLELFEKAGRQVGMLRQPVDVNKLIWK